MQPQMRCFSVNILNMQLNIDSCTYCLNLRDILEETEELIKIFVASIKTAEKKKK